MKTNENFKQLSLAVLVLILAGFFSGCAATGTASDATADGTVAGNSGKKGRKAKKEE